MVEVELPVSTERNRDEFFLMPIASASKDPEFLTDKIPAPEQTTHPELNVLHALHTLHGDDTELGQNMQPHGEHETGPELPETSMKISASGNLFVSFKDFSFDNFTLKTSKVRKLEMENPKR